MQVRGFYRWLVVGGVAVATLAFHYGWNPFGGEHSHVVHSIHGRLCYVPILLAAGWFGLRGGILTAAGISLAVMPYILSREELGVHELTTEYVEIVFYFALGALTGWLFDRQRGADDKRIEAERKLAHTERLGMLGRMVATVAHEIRNPLGSIRGSVEILSDEIAHDNPKHEFVEIIQAETERLDTIVNTYLEYSNPKAPERASGDLGALVEEVVRTFPLKDERIRVETKVARHLVAEFDSGQIRRVVLNLLRNAVEALPGGGQVSVTVGRHDTKAEIEIRDNGQGIPRDVAGQIFQPFVTSKANGSGLGLSLSREIVEAHGGTLQLLPSKAPETGARFVISLPLKTGAV